MKNIQKEPEERQEEKFFHGKKKKKIEMKEEKIEMKEEDVYKVARKAIDLRNTLEKQFKQIENENDKFTKKSEDTINSINFDQKCVQLKYNWDEIIDYNKINNWDEMTNFKLNENYDEELQKSIKFLDEQKKIRAERKENRDDKAEAQDKLFRSKIDEIYKEFEHICDIGNQLKGLKGFNETIDDLNANMKQLEATRSELKMETANEEKTLQTFRNKLEEKMKTNKSLKQLLNQGLDAHFIEIVYKNQKLIYSHSESASDNFADLYKSIASTIRSVSTNQKLINLIKEECKL
eukprot:507658_1